MRYGGYNCSTLSRWFESFAIELSSLIRKDELVVSSTRLILFSFHMGKKNKKIEPLYSVLRIRQIVFIPYELFNMSNKRMLKWLLLFFQLFVTNFPLLAFSIRLIFHTSSLLSTLFPNYICFIPS